jgi:hypothetical protein
MEIKASTKVTEALKMSKKVADLFREYKLDCPGCRGVVEETIDKVAFNNGLKLEDFLKDLNNALK